MVHPAAATLLRVALDAGVLLIAALLVWLCARAKPDDPDGADPGSDGGSRWPRRRPPRRPPPPGGPVSWPEFERQFAAYVARCADSPASRRGGDRQHAAERVP